MATIELTERERHVMSHAAGHKLPPHNYRNRFVTGPGTDDWKTLQALCVRGFMKIVGRPSELSGGDTVFAVTDAGFAALAERGEGR